MLSEEHFQENSVFVRRVNKNEEIDSFGDVNADHAVLLVKAEKGKSLTRANVNTLTTISNALL